MLLCYDCTHFKMNFKGFMWMNICLPVCMRTTHMQCQWKPEEGVEYPRTGVQIVLRQHVSSGNQTLDP